MNPNTKLSVENRNKPRTQWAEHPHTLKLHTYGLVKPNFQQNSTLEPEQLSLY